MTFRSGRVAETNVLELDAVSNIDVGDTLIWVIRGLDFWNLFNQLDYIVATAKSAHNFWVKCLDLKDSKHCENEGLVSTDDVIDSDVTIVVGVWHLILDHEKAYEPREG